jgi:hypothetical protein
VVRKFDVPRDDLRVDEIVKDPEAYFEKVRVKVQADATHEIDRRIARRSGRLRSLLARAVRPRQLTSR